jgi:ferrous iron transport protein B
MTLKELQIGKSAIVDAVGGAGALRQHFLDMGLIPGAEVPWATPWSCASTVMS